MKQKTNNGKPHVCNTIQVHNGTKDKVTLCGFCHMPIDNPEEKTLGEIFTDMDILVEKTIVEFKEPKENGQIGEVLGVPIFESK